MQVFVRNLRADEDVAARDAASAHGLADGRLGAVFPGRIDMPVAGFQRRSHVLGGDVTHARGAEADGRNFGVVRLKHRGKSGH
jgi:hypothetical protein